MTTCAIELLDCAGLPDVPCIVRFLINKSPTCMVPDVVSAMRRKLNIGEMNQVSQLLAGTH